MTTLDETVAQHDDILYGPNRNDGLIVSVAHIERWLEKEDKRRDQQRVATMAGAAALAVNLIVTVLLALLHLE